MKEAFYVPRNRLMLKCYSFFLHDLPKNRSYPFSHPLFNIMIPIFDHLTLAGSPYYSKSCNPIPVGLFRFSKSHASNKGKTARGCQNGIHSMGIMLRTPLLLFFQHVFCSE